VFRAVLRRFTASPHFFLFPEKHEAVMDAAPADAAPAPVEEIKRSKRKR
jgi:hypothetical protein